jgi:hypothetical protein
MSIFRPLSDLREVPSGICRHHHICCRLPTVCCCLGRAELAIVKTEELRLLHSGEVLLIRKQISRSSSSIELILTVRVVDKSILFIVFSRST